MAFLYCFFSSYTAIYGQINLYCFDKLAHFATDLFHIYGSCKMALSFTVFMEVTIELYLCIHIYLYSYASIFVYNRWLQLFIVAIIVCSHWLSPSMLTRTEGTKSQKAFHLYKVTISIKLRTVWGHRKPVLSSIVLAHDTLKLKEMYEKCIW